jgi:hypothetical protein
MSPRPIPRKFRKKRKTYHILRRPIPLFLRYHHCEINETTLLAKSSNVTQYIATLVDLSSYPRTSGIKYDITLSAPTVTPITVTVHLVEIVTSDIIINQWTTGIPPYLLSSALSSAKLYSPSVNDTKARLIHTRRGTIRSSFGTSIISTCHINHYIPMNSWTTTSRCGRILPSRQYAFVVMIQSHQNMVLQSPLEMYNKISVAYRTN